MKEQWQSDHSVKLTQQKEGDNVVYNIIVKSENDDTSRSPKLEVSLPRNSKVNAVIFEDAHTSIPYQVLGNAAQALTHNPERIDGSIHFDLPSLNREQLRITISIKEVDTGWGKLDGLSAYVHSLTPELNKENNFKYLPLPI